MNNKKNDPEHILRKGRVNLLMHHPFYGELALRLRLIETKFLPTTAVDARGNLYYNPDWVAKNFNDTSKPMTTDDAMCEFAHEILHLMFRHHARKPAGAIHSIWNLACDQIIDTHLVESNMVQSSVSKKMVPEEVQEACKRPDGKIKTSEQRYRELEKELQKCPKCAALLKAFKENADKQQTQNQQNTNSQQSQDDQTDGKGNNQSDEQSQGDSGASNEGSSNAGGDECPGHGSHGDSSGSNNSSQAGGSEEGSGAESENNGLGSGHICQNVRLCCAASMDEADIQTVEEWKQHIISAAKTAKSRGNCPSIAEDFIAELERPSRDWRDIIRAQASQVYRGRYTQKRPSRRSWATGVRMPARQPKPNPAIVAMDCSGSVSHMAARFAAEAVGIMEAAGAPEVIIMFHDMVVYHMDTYKKKDLRKLKVSHGGTSHKDVFEKLNELEIKPGVLVCMTDLYSDQMEIKNPGIPTVWAHPRGEGEDMPIPFGKKVEVADLGND